MILVDTVGYGPLDPILEAVRIQPYSISEYFEGQN